MFGAARLNYICAQIGFLFAPLPIYVLFVTDINYLVCRYFIGFTLMAFLDYSITNYRAIPDQKVHSLDKVLSTI